MVVKLWGQVVAQIAIKALLGPHELISAAISEAISQNGDGEALIGRPDWKRLSGCKTLGSVKVLIRDHFPKKEKGQDLKGLRMTGSGSEESRAYLFDCKQINPMDSTRTQQNFPRPKQETSFSNRYAAVFWSILITTEASRVKSPVAKLQPPTVALPLTRAPALPSPVPPSAEAGALIGGQVGPLGRPSALAIWTSIAGLALRWTPIFDTSGRFALATKSTPSLGF